MAVPFHGNSLEHQTLLKHGAVEDLLFREQGTPLLPRHLRTSSTCTLFSFPEKSEITAAFDGVVRVW